jgi:hypothetical protein
VALWLAVGLSVAIVSIAIGAYLAWVLAVNRRAGISGLYRRLRLTCPKCAGSFDYDLVPGGSFTAVRLGTRRYLRCPLCHRASVFPMTPDPTAPVRSTGPAAPPPVA